MTKLLNAQHAVMCTRWGGVQLENTMPTKMCWYKIGWW